MAHLRTKQLSAVTSQSSLHSLQLFLKSFAFFSHISQLPLSFLVSLKLSLRFGDLGLQVLSCRPKARDFIFGILSKLTSSLQPLLDVA
jgi:hypothetical protein